MKEFEYQIKRCKEEDLKDVVKFVKRLGPDNVIQLKPSVKYFLWKYKDRNSSKKRLPLIAIINRGNKVIGISGAMPVKLFTPQGIVNAVWGTDAIIELSYKKYPFLFPQMAYLLRKSIIVDYVSLTFPRTKEFSWYLKKIGNVFLSLYVFIFKIRKNCNFCLNSSLMRFETINCFKKNINSFFKRVSSQYDFIICRDKDYLNWRYFHYPFYKYTVITALKNKKILGYIVVRKEKETKIGYILDILGDLNSPRCIYFLIFRALQYFKKEEVEYVYCLLSHKKYMAMFRKIGFYPYRREECLANFKNAQLQNEFLQKKNWHITMGDGDFWGVK
jgi:rRNA processing protein Gar1